MRVACLMTQVLFSVPTYLFQAIHCSILDASLHFSSTTQGRCTFQAFQSIDKVFTGLDLSNIKYIMVLGHDVYSTDKDYCMTRTKVEVVVFC